MKSFLVFLLKVTGYGVLSSIMGFAMGALANNWNVFATLPSLDKSCVEMLHTVELTNSEYLDNKLFVDNDACYLELLNSSDKNIKILNSDKQVVRNLLSGYAYRSDDYYKKEIMLSVLSGEEKICDIVIGSGKSVKLDPEKRKANDLIGLKDHESSHVFHKYLDFNNLEGNNP